MQDFVFPRYFLGGTFGDAAGLAPFLVNSGLAIIFNGLFEVHISGGIYKKSRIPRRLKIQKRSRLPGPH